MIPIPSGVRVWIATGHTDMRRGMQGLALQVQEQLKRDPHAGDLYIFRGRRGDLAKILWHDGIGLSPSVRRRGLDLGGPDGLYARGPLLMPLLFMMILPQIDLRDTVISQAANGL